VGDRGVDEEEPEAEEHRVAPELEPVGGGPRDQRRGDDGEHELEGAEGQRGDCQGEVAGVAGKGEFGVGDVLEADEVEVADELPAVAEGQAEADHGPQHADEAHGEEVLHEHAEYVLGPDHSAVEEGQARGHEQHQRR
jgi:hypothetical protein